MLIQAKSYHLVRQEFEKSANILTNCITEMTQKSSVKHVTGKKEKKEKKVGIPCQADQFHFSL